MAEEGKIIARGVRVNNLRNVDVDIPRGNLVVITGLSGSGKSSLAFDTLYAEGQRRYVESLSSYARQFLGRLPKPEADFIRGLPPAIAIEQKVNTRNPRSTVGTTTEIYDYLRLLYARVGHTISPVSGQRVTKHSADDVAAAALELPRGTRVALSAPVILPPKRRWETQLDIFRQEGFSRLIHPLTGSIEQLEDTAVGPDDGYELLIDRTVVDPDNADETSRLADSAETAFFEGGDTLSLLAWPEGADKPVRTVFSKRFEADGMAFIEPSDALFNFNNPYGACPRCEGFGRTIGIDERLVVPNPRLSVYEDGVACWRGEKMSEWKRLCIRHAAAADFPIHRPYAELTEAQKDFLWHGDGRGFGGIDAFFDMVESNRHKVQYRVMAARYRGKTTCPVCRGRRLRKEAHYVKVGGRGIAELVTLPVTELRKFFAELQLSPTEQKIAARLLKEITSRLEFLDDVGLGYLTLDRLSATLSGGESQRINLATSLGSSLMGSLYILDEPSIGLHPRDTRRLLSVLRRLQQAGNTVVIVEHDEEIMREADYIIDVGPDAGRLGGQILYQGPLEGLLDVKGSYTADYLSGRRNLPAPQRRKWRDYIEFTGVRQHNLKDITVRLPLGVMTAVTGVSGSGKSSLIRDVVFNSLSRRFGNAADEAGDFSGMHGDIDKIQAVEFIDQNPIGKSSRSNPATYLKAYDEIRRLFADQQAARQMGFSPGHFSFNTDGGRCDECKGEGTITIEMQFMADITIPCETCHGTRFKRDILEVAWRGLNIAQVLDLTVDEAIAFFGAEKEGQRVARRLQPLADVGLGYIKLGQSSSTLSGGENQRVKLAYYLAMEEARPTMFIFDEPTTGLHFHDIARLLDSFNRLISKGHTVVIIEHNPDVIRAADHVIDLGPEGGEAGGQIVATGTPEQIAANPASHTGAVLRL